MKAPSVCGDGAVIVLAERAMTVRVNGAAIVSLPSESVRPDGAEATVSAAVLGSSRTVRVVVRPDASRAVAASSR